MKKQFTLKIWMDDSGDLTKEDLVWNLGVIADEIENNRMQGTGETFSWALIESNFQPYANKITKE